MIQQYSTILAIIWGFFQPKLLKILIFSLITKYKLKRNLKEVA